MALRLNTKDNLLGNKAITNSRMCRILNVGKAPNENVLVVARPSLDVDST